ncbi:MAG: hypothetical protein QOE61_5819, partial [Micromonosporaceae bacterium]|nr:hypothetical protein [Micromonosporaceae bacterium]
RRIGIGSREDTGSRLGDDPGLVLVYRTCMGGPRINGPEPPTSLWAFGASMAKLGYLLGAMHD